MFFGNRFIDQVPLQENHECVTEGGSMTAVVVGQGHQYAKEKRKEKNFFGIKFLFKVEMKD